VLKGVVTLQVHQYIISESSACSVMHLGVCHQFYSTFNLIEKLHKLLSNIVGYINSRSDSIALVKMIWRRA